MLSVEQINNIIDLYKDGDIFTFNYIYNLDLQDVDVFRKLVELIQLNETQLDTPLYYAKRKEFFERLGFTFNAETGDLEYEYKCMKTYDEIVQELDEIMVDAWDDYNPADLNHVIIGLIQNHEPYINMQPYYIDYLIEDLERLKESV